MWARVVEMMLGAWLAASPFVFRHPADQDAWWWTDLGAAGAVVVFALASYWRPLQHAHLLTAGVGAWLIGFGYLGSPYPTPPALQNDIVVGLVLIVFAIVPNEASQPPRAWREADQKRADSPQPAAELHEAPSGRGGRGGRRRRRPRRDGRAHPHRAGDRRA